MTMIRNILLVLSLLSLYACSGSNDNKSVNIVQFGAKNGEVSDSAIQLAINQAEDGQLILIPQGTYYITKTLQLKDNTRIVGVSKEESILMLSDGICSYDYPKCRMIVANNAKNILIQNMTLDGNSAVTKGVAVDFDNVSSYLLDNIKVSNFSSHGIAFNNGCTNGLIKNCEVKNIGQFGISIFRNGHYNKITDNKLINSVYGIVIDDTTTGIESIASSNNLVAGNTLHNSILGIVVEGSNNNVVENNYLFSSGGALAAIDIWAGGYDGVSRPLGQSNIVRNNTIDYVASQYLMRVMGIDLLIENNIMSGALYDGIYIRSIRDWDNNSANNYNIKLKNNKIRNTGRNAISLEECDTCNISSNIISESGNYGIQVLNPYNTNTSNIDIVDNIFDKVGYIKGIEQKAVSASGNETNPITNLRLINNTCTVGDCIYLLNYYVFGY